MRFFGKPLDSFFTSEAKIWAASKNLRRNASVRAGRTRVRSGTTLGADRMGVAAGRDASRHSGNAPAHPGDHLPQSGTLLHGVPARDNLFSTQGGAQTVRRGFQQSEKGAF